jgi:hypothetical protein
MDSDDGREAPHARERVRHCRLGAFAARIGLARLVAELAGRGSFPLARRMVSLASRGEFTRADEHVLAPFTKSPREVRLALNAIWTQPKCFHALREEIQSLPVSAVTAFIALLVFEKLGVGILRRAWINLDVIWAAALLATGTMLLML